MSFALWSGSVTVWETFSIIHVQSIKTFTPVEMPLIRWAYPASIPSAPVDILQGTHLLCSAADLTGMRFPSRHSVFYPPRYPSERATELKSVTCPLTGTAIHLTPGIFLQEWQAAEKLRSLARLHCRLCGYFPLLAEVKEPAHAG